jgi:uncharacterized cupredoxin-like copper-binding protein
VASESITPVSPPPATASPAPSASPAPTATPVPTATPAPSASPSASQATGSVIQLEETEDLQILQDGQPVTQLRVKLGDSIVFKIDNIADFDHNFFIGPAKKLSKGDTDGLPGIPSFQGSKEFTYTVTAATADLQFGCPLEGHYETMHGTFVVTP